MTFWALVVICAAAAPASFTPLGDLEKNVRSTAVAASADGSVVVGFARGNALDEAARWTRGDIAGLGKLDLDGEDRSWAWAVSADGKVIAGTSTATRTNSQPVLWRAGAKPERLPLPEGFEDGEARALSGDGRVAGGHASRPCGEGACELALLWRGGKVSVVDGGRNVHITGLSHDGAVASGALVGLPDGMQAAVRIARGKVERLGMLPGSKTSTAHAVSARGDVVVGDSWPGAFRWEKGKLEDLGRLPGFALCSARAVSADGLRIIGTCAHEDGMRSESFLWERGRGMRSVADALAEAGAPVPGEWRLDEAFGLSADGTTIVGDADGPRGHEAWMAVLPRR